MKNSFISIDASVGHFTSNLMSNINLLKKFIYCCCCRYQSVILPCQKPLLDKILESSEQTAVFMSKNLKPMDTFMNCESLCISEHRTDCQICGEEASATRGKCVPQNLAGALWSQGVLRCNNALLISLLCSRIDTKVSS